MKSTTTDSNLPQELVNEILLRLPVKELLRCKCVCKQWYALIESPSFVKQHYGHESNQERLLVRLKKPDRRGYKYALYVDETFSNYEEPRHLQIPEIHHALLIDDLEIPEGEHLNLIGPLNGVFCVADVSVFGPFALLNPALRQFKPLPRLDLRICPSNFGVIGSELGLGLDPFTNDYKLVLIMYFWESSVGYYSDYYPVVCACTSGSDSWTLVEDVDPIVSKRMANKSTSNTYLNGVYYWLLEFGFVDSTRADVATVLAFDMRTDKFRVIEATGCVSETQAGTLALCGDSLSLLLFDRNRTDRCIDVWIMRDEECWIRSSKVGPLEEDMWSVISFWRNNELLMETFDSFLALYNVRTQESKAIEAQKADGGRELNWSYVYKESLVSIKGGAGECKLWDPSSDFINKFFNYLSI